MCCVCSVTSGFVTPWTVAQQAPLSMEFSRQECWGNLLFASGALPDPGLNPCPLHLLHWQANSWPLHHLTSLSHNGKKWHPPPCPMQDASHLGHSPLKRATAGVTDAMLTAALGLWSSCHSSTDGGWRRVGLGLKDIIWKYWDRLPTRSRAVWLTADLVLLKLFCPLSLEHSLVQHPESWDRGWTSFYLANSHLRPNWSGKNAVLIIIGLIVLSCILFRIQ